MAKKPKSEKEPSNARSGQGKDKALTKSEAAELVAQLMAETQSRWRQNPELAVACSSEERAGPGGN